LADSVADYAVERAELVDKTRGSSLLTPDREPPSLDDAGFQEWFAGGGRASAADPTYYLAPYEPRLFCFENQAPGHPYVESLQRAVAEASLDHLFTLADGATMHPDMLPTDAKPIDLVWWDSPGFETCYRLFWPALNPSGGTMILHDVATGLDSANWDWFCALRADHPPDMETLTLVQPHKLDQNSCAMLRRTTSYAPPFVRSHPVEQLRAARALVDLVEKE
jgi:hypothetical protein